MEGHCIFQAWRVWCIHWELVYLNPSALLKDSYVPQNLYPKLQDSRVFLHLGTNPAVSSIVTKGFGCRGTSLVPLHKDGRGQNKVPGGGVFIFCTTKEREGG